MSTLQAAAQNQLRQFVEQIERLAEERKAISDDIADKFSEAKSVGFDTKALKRVIMLRRKSRSERQEEEAVLDVYLHALGMLDDEHATRLRDAMAAVHATEIKTDEAAH